MTRETLIEIYRVQAGVAPGSSGSPVVLPSGQVAGVVFSMATGSPDNAYALTSATIAPALHKAEVSRLRVSTGACVE